MSRTRSRTFLTGKVSGQKRTTCFDAFAPYSNAGVDNTESVTDSVHTKLSGGRWSGGGPFDLTRSTTTWSGNQATSVVWRNSGNVCDLGQGTVRIQNPSGSNPAPLVVLGHPSAIARNAMATSAIAAIEPTQPAFDLSVFLGELRAEGLPNLPGTATRESTRAAKAAGGEYLNVEFGWLPLVRGVRDFARTVANSDKILNSYQEQSNQVIKRSYEWPTESKVQAYSCSHVMEPPVGFFTGGGHFERTFRRSWLEAEFLYFLPTGGSQTAKNQRFGSYARKLLGISLSPEVLWNLSPWSWAADWFGNVGDVMHNISAFGTDGLVMRNGWFMCHSGLTRVDSGTFKNRYQVRTRVDERKTRDVATPFGFGLTDADLSPRQFAIMAALGLAHT